MSVLCSRNLFCVKEEEQELGWEKFGRGGCGRGSARVWMICSCKDTHGHTIMPAEFGEIPN